MVEDAEEELHVKDSDPFFQSATYIQGVINHFPLGRYVPIVLLYVFKV